jgi:hypothetical protein
MQEKRGVTHINMMDLLQQYAIGNGEWSLAWSHIVRLNLLLINNIWCVQLKPESQFVRMYRESFVQ